MKRPNILTLTSWERHEKCVIKIFLIALNRLILRNSIPLYEDDLSKELSILINKIIVELSRKGVEFNTLPYYQPKIQPTSSDNKLKTKKLKNPDFLWGFLNSQEGKRYEFTIECKRIGKPSSPSWILNKNYVYHGVKRFEDPEWGYGEECHSGAMLGYIQSMEHNEILIQVNKYNQKNNYSEIHLTDRNWKINGTSQLKQIIDRRIKPSPFKIIHLWVDLRNSYNKN